MDWEDKVERIISVSIAIVLGLAAAWGLGFTIWFIIQELIF
jgi:hypothetical protein